MEFNEQTIIKAISKELANSSTLIDANRGTEHKINFIFEGEAVVKRGEDYSQNVNFAIPYDKIVAILFSKLNNVTMESVLVEALASDLDSSDIKRRASEALKKLKGVGNRNMKGKVTIPSCSLSIKEVDICEYC